MAIWLWAKPVVCGAFLLTHGHMRPSLFFALQNISPSQKRREEESGVRGVVKAVWAKADHAQALGFKMF